MEASQATSITDASLSTTIKPFNKVVLIPPSYFLPLQPPSPNNHQIPTIPLQKNPLYPLKIKPTTNNSPLPRKSAISFLWKPNSAPSSAVPSGSETRVSLSHAESALLTGRSDTGKPKEPSSIPSSSPMGLRMLLQAAKSNVSANNSPQRGSVNNEIAKVKVPERETELPPSTALEPGNSSTLEKEESPPLEGEGDGGNTDGVKLTKSAKKRFKKKAKLKAQKEEMLQELLLGSVGVSVPTSCDLSKQSSAEVNYSSAEEDNDPNNVETSRSTHLNKEWNGVTSDMGEEKSDLKDSDETAEMNTQVTEVETKKAKKKKKKVKIKKETEEMDKQEPEVVEKSESENASPHETQSVPPAAKPATGVHEVTSTPNLRAAVDLLPYPNVVHCLPRSLSCSALLPPIGIFWDIENCQVPRSKSALDMVTVLRKRWENKYREVEFVVACDTLKEDACVLQELHHANVTVVHVFSISKNAADEKLRQLMRKFTETYEAPYAAILISSDINFAGDLHALKRAGVHVILYHNDMVSKALQMSSHETYAFPDLLKCVPNKVAVAPKQTTGVDQLAQSRSQVVVSNLPEKNVQLIKTRLNQLSDNCGGKFVCKIGEKAILDFATPLAAARASKRMEGEDVFGSKIHCSKPFVSEIRRPPVGRVGTAPLLLGTPYRYKNGPFPPPPNPLQLEPPKLRFPNTVGPPITPPRFAKPTPIRDAFKEAAICVDRPDYYRTPSEYLVETTPEGYRRIRGTHRVIQPDKSTWSVPGVLQLDKGTSFVNQERNTADGHSSSSSSCSSTSPPPNPVDLHVTNLDSAMEPRHVKKLLKTAFSEHVTVLHVAVQQQSDGSLSATVRVPSLHDAQCAVSMLHRKKLGFKRMMIAYSSPRTPSPQQLR